MLVKVGDTIQTGLDMLQVELAQASASDKAAKADTAVEAKSASAAPAPKTPAAPTSPPAAAVQTVEVRVPDIGGDKAPVVELSVAVGDQIQVDDPLVTLESDKATMEVPSTHVGKIVAVHAKVGDELGEGDLLVTVETSAQAVAPTPAATPEPAVAAAPAPATTPVTPASVSTPAHSPATPSTTSTQSNKLIYAGPAVRRLAREFGVDLTLVQGTGEKGRLLKEDVQNYVKNQLANPAAAGVSASSGGLGIPAIPRVDFSQWGEVEIQPLNKLRLVAAQNFQRSWLNIPHVTQFDDADITDMEAFRQAQKAAATTKGVRLTPLPFLLKAVAYALQEMPQFCASLAADGQSRVLKKYINIGIAVDTPDGLVVPVIKDVDKKGLWALAAECAELADKARTKKLNTAEMKGGCFTISSLGSIGGTAFTPIVNTPEVAILGVSKATIKPVWNGQEFIPRLMLPLSLSYDHRAINGAEAASFTALLARLLSDLRSMLL